MMSSAHTLLLRFFVVACAICGSYCFKYGSTGTGGDFTGTGDDFTEPKYINRGEIMMCNGTLIMNRIYSNLSYWGNCQNVGSKGDESFINAFWRVYTCVLAKFKGDDTETMSLLEFSQIITASYPDEMKKSINSLVKSLGETQGKENTWLTSKIKLTDYSNVDKIRAQYYNIEKAFCENGTDLLLENTLSLKSWDECSLREELMYRGSDCCNNNTIPFGRQYNDLASTLFNLTECERILTSAIGQLFENNSTKRYLLYSYGFTCYLVEKSIMTIDEIRKVKMDERQMRLILNVSYPFIPTKIHDTVTAKMVTMYNETLVTQNVNFYLQYLNVTNLTEDEKSFVHSCQAFNIIRYSIPLYELACPETNYASTMDYIL